MAKVKALNESLSLFVYKSNDWYLYAYCSTRNDFRFFKLTRIRNLETSNACYSRPIPNQIFTEPETFEMEMIHVTLRFDKSLSFKVYDKFDDEVTENQDGTLFVETIMPNNELLFSYILSLGDKVEVLAPESIRNKLDWAVSNKHHVVYIKHYNLSVDSNIHQVD